MKLLCGLQRFSELSSGTVATIGNFDGVHRGHQALLTSLRSQAVRLQLPLVVVVFEPQPGEYFHGQQAPARLSSLREKLEVFRHSGVDYVLCVKFNHKLASMPAMQFAEDYIFTSLRARYLLVGEDFHFGHDRLGDVTTLCELGCKQACVVQKFPDFFIDEFRVSSTIIRQALHDGELDCAAKLLGRPYSICGRVVRGDGRGRQWGVPTANLSLHRNTLPLNGVFCVQVQRPGRPLLEGVANMGCRPTVDGRKNILEVHLFDVDELLYGEMLQVSFLHKLRDEIKFSSIEALIAQIHVDVADAKVYYGRSRA